jgi:hypothetical protein
LDSEWKLTLTEYIRAGQRSDEIRKAFASRARESFAQHDSLRMKWEESGPHSAEDAKAMSLLLEESAQLRREHSSRMVDLLESIALRNEKYREDMLTMCDQIGANPIDVVKKMRDELQSRLEEFPSLEEAVFKSDELTKRLRFFVDERRFQTKPSPAKKSRWS